VYIFYFFILFSSYRSLKCVRDGQLRPVIRHINITTRSSEYYSPSGTKFRHKKLKSLGAAHSEDFVILACTVLIQIQSVTDTQTDRQTDRRPSHS